MVCSSCQREIAASSNFCYICGARQAAPAPRTEVRPKRLMRSSADKDLGGVCAGFAEYFGVDPTVVRVVWVLITLFFAIVPGVLGYLIAWYLIPLAPLPAALPQETAPGAASQQSAAQS
jgi:phage shock protein C